MRVKPTSLLASRISLVAMNFAIAISKGVLPPKILPHIRQQGEQRDVCYLFEGFMDYLSFLTIRMNNNPEEPRTNEQDYMVLNSVTNLSKAEQLLRPYTESVASSITTKQGKERMRI